MHRGRIGNKGYKVVACDVDEQKIAKINQGIPPFFEPGLQEKLSEAITNGNLVGVTGNLDEVIGQTELTFVAVGTPSKPDGSIDLTYIESAAKNIGSALAKKAAYHMVVVKSTVVPGTRRVGTLGYSFADPLVEVARQGMPTVDLRPGRRRRGPPDPERSTSSAAACSTITSSPAAPAARPRRPHDCHPRQGHGGGTATESSSSSSP